MCLGPPLLTKNDQKKRRKYLKNDRRSFITMNMGTGVYLSRCVPNKFIIYCCIIAFENDFPFLKNNLTLRRMPDILENTA